MIWLSWRQHRKQAMFTLIAMVVLAAIMIPTGLAMRHEFADSGLGGCLDRMGTAQLIRESAAVADCQRLSHQFQQHYNNLVFVAVLFVILPLLVGMFFGAPLVAREVEDGTHRLVWTQGVSRRRWALVKFGLVGAITLPLALMYALGVSWWFGPLLTASSARLNYLAFDVQGIAPIGYTFFAVALGVFAGTVWRKVLPAMGAAVVGFAGVRLAIETLARPRYMAPKTLSFSPQSALLPNPATGDWIMRSGVRNAAGRLVVPNGEVGPCGPSGCGAQVDALGPGVHNWLQVQPGSRYWAFQTIETGIFLVLAALLIYLAVRRLRRIA